MKVKSIMALPSTSSLTESSTCRILINDSKFKVSFVALLFYDCSGLMKAGLVNYRASIYSLRQAMKSG